MNVFVPVPYAVEGTPCLKTLLHSPLSALSQLPIPQNAMPVKAVELTAFA
jgi:hypothetical protein